MGSVGSVTNNISVQIKNEFLQHGLNSRFKGVKRNAENGTGNYAFKNATLVTPSQAMSMTSITIQERNGNTLVTGLIGDRLVYYANRSTDTTIEKLKKRKQILASNNKIETERFEINTTTTYDRWRKRNKSNFDAWFGKR